MGGRDLYLFKHVICFFKQPLKQFNKVACMLAALLIMVA